MIFSSTLCEGSLRDVATRENLTPLYGKHRANALANYVEAFLPFERTYSPVTAQIRNPSKPLLFVSVTVRSRDQICVCVVVEFPLLFPQVPPRFVTPIAADLEVQPNHPQFNSCGVLRTNSSQLVAMHLVLGEVANGVNRHPPLRKPQADAVHGKNASSDALHVDVQRTLAVRSRLYLERRQRILECSSHIEAQAGDCAMQKNLLTERLRHLEGVLASTTQARAEAKHLSSQSNPILPSMCISCDGELATHALNLISYIHATEDQLDIMEKCLRFETMSCDVYVKLVTQIARQAFEHKVLLRRTMGRLYADSIVDELRIRFSFDNNLIRDVLRNADYDKEAAANLLSSMVDSQS